MVYIPINPSRTQPKEPVTSSVGTEGFVENPNALALLPSFSDFHEVIGNGLADTVEVFTNNTDQDMRIVAQVVGSGASAGASGRASSYMSPGGVAIGDGGIISVASGGGFFSSNGGGIIGESGVSTLGFSARSGIGGRFGYGSSRSTDTDSAAGYAFLVTTLLKGESATLTAGYRVTSPSSNATGRGGFGLVRLFIAPFYN